jgi:predicted Zn-dependent peptidase
MRTLRRILPAAWLALATLAALPGLAAAVSGPPPASAYFTLDNGLQVLLQEKRGPGLVAITLAVDIGTKDETEASSGYAHLLEHLLLFGGGGDGSEARLAELRRHGVAHNAHTDHDLMTFEASCPAAEGAWALERVREAVFSWRPDPALLEGEKQVIAEEILQLRDDPDRLGRLRVMERLFAGHAYGRPVYGDGAAIRAASVESVEAFCRPRLVPGRCALVVVGDFLLAEMEAQVRRAWGALPAGGESALKGAEPALAVAAPADAGRLEKNSEERIELDISESHLFIAWRAPAFNDDMRLPFTLLTYVLGRGLNPVLGAVLRGGRALADRVDMSYLPMRHGGMAVLHLVLAERNLRSAAAETAAFLSRIGSFKFSRQDVMPQYRDLMPDYLESAKNQMAYGDGAFRESALNLSTAAARYLLLNRASAGGSYLDSMERLDGGDLRRAAGRVLSGKKWALLAITPLAAGARRGK